MLIQEQKKYGYRFEKGLISFKVQVAHQCYCTSMHYFHYLLGSVIHIFQARNQRGKQRFRHIMKDWNTMKYFIYTALFTVNCLLSGIQASHTMGKNFKENLPLL